MEKLFDINEEGFSVRCKLYCSDTAAVNRVIVLCHGFTGHKENRSGERLAERVLSKYKGVALVSFDWPAHGEDARKSISLTECDTYLRLVLAYCRGHFHTDELYAFAVSFGGYVLLKYLSEHGNPFRAAVLRCPAVPFYRSMTETIMKSGDRDRISRGKPAEVGFDRKVRVTPAFLEETRTHDAFGFDLAACADRLLILHGTKDELIPFEEVQRFALEKGIDFVPVQNADHRFSDRKAMDQVIEYTLLHFDL